MKSDCRPTSLSTTLKFSPPTSQSSLSLSLTHSLFHFLSLSLTFTESRAGKGQAGAEGSGGWGARPECGRRGGRRCPPPPSAGARSLRGRRRRPRPLPTREIWGCSPLEWVLLTDGSAGLWHCDHGEVFRKIQWNPSPIIHSK